MRREQEASQGVERKPLAWRRTLLWLTSAGLGLLCLRVAQAWPTSIERFYSLGFYPRVRASLAGAARVLPFSVAEALFVLLLGWLVAWGLWGLVKALRGKEGWLRITAGGFLRLLRCAAGAWLLFLLLWGGNHARLSLAVSAGLPAVQDREQALQSLVRELVGELNRDQAASNDPAGFAVFDPDGAPDPRIPGALKTLSGSLACMAGEVPVLRRMTAWPLFARLGISGIFIPFTGEPHINAGVPACRWPFVAFHEIAHQRGFAREDEANFLGWLLCVTSGDVHYRYAGNLAALSIALGPLQAMDPQLAGDLVADLSAPVLRDMRAVQEFWRAYESPARAMGERINDAYLKSQGQAHGVRSYGRMLQLMLSYRSQGGLGRE